MHLEGRDSAGQATASFATRNLHGRRLYMPILTLGLGEKAVSVKYGSANVPCCEVQILQHDLTS
jgi:hypothetical protein